MVSNLVAVQGTIGVQTKPLVTLTGYDNKLIVATMMEWNFFRPLQTDLIYLHSIFLLNHF